MSFSMSTSASPCWSPLDAWEPPPPLAPPAWHPVGVAPSTTVIGIRRPIGPSDALNHEVGQRLLVTTLEAHQQLQRDTLLRHPRLFMALEDRFQRYHHLINRSNTLLCGQLPGEDRESLRKLINQGLAAHEALTALLTQAHDPGLGPLLQEMSTAASSASELVSKLQGPWPNGLRRHGDPLGLDDLIWSMDRADTLKDCRHAVELLNDRVKALNAEYLEPSGPARSCPSGPGARWIGSASASGPSPAWLQDPWAQGGAGTGPLKRRSGAVPPAVAEAARTTRAPLSAAGPQTAKEGGPQAKQLAGRDAVVADVMRDVARDMATELEEQMGAEMEEVLFAAPRWQPGTNGWPPTSSQGTPEGR